ncbi:PP2C family protein-serine/threonine phosphatase [Polymorphospora rubra]|uniref:PP2C family protein-serine/threonine phosphatase n=1 Tax=Polymorphospora rubra TaxID=338584 RepID=UPI001BB3756B|nr:PP2C family protein-serine/threonine phosphatase [Polymorphospora rubra]
MQELFERAGALRAAYQRVDWASTPLGPVESWTPTLRATVDLALQTRFPVTLFWGPELVLVYNEAYVPMIGDKHPAALGTPASAVFSEIWDSIGPMLTGVLSGERATWSEDLELFMDRHGFAEQCFFTFSYSAVRSPEGQVEGVIDIAAETTGQVVSRRRLVLLAQLTEALKDLDDPQRILRQAVTVLRANAQDLLDADILLPAVAVRESATALPAVPPSVSGDRDMVVEELGGRTVVRLRLATSSPVRQNPVLVARLNPHLPVDDGYIRFVRLVGVAITQAFDRAQARQTERRIAELERQMSESLQRSLLTPPARPEHVEVAVRYQPAAAQMQVGGDWYDAFLLPDGVLALVIGDVTGHDPRAAAGMAQIRNLLRGVATTLRKPPSFVLAALDTALDTLAVNALATAVLAHVEQSDEQATDRRWTLRWSNAGHPPPVLIRPDGVATLLWTPTDTMLGVQPDAVRRDHAATLEPGSTVVLYTDGLIDRRGVLIDDGLADLTRALTDRQSLSAEQVCDHLLARYADQSDDDIALVVLRVPPDIAADVERRDAHA